MHPSDQHGQGASSLTTHTRLSTRIRLILFILVAAFHFVSFTLFTVVGFLNPERYVEIGSRIFSGLSFITAAIGACHWAYFPQRHHIRPRNLVLFSLLTTLSFGNLVLLLVQVTNKNLLLALGALQSPQAASATVLAFSGLSTLFSALGLVIAYFHCHHEPLPKPKLWISPPIPQQTVESQPGTPSIRSIVPGHLSPKYDPALIPVWRPTNTYSGDNPRLQERWSDISLR
ncbi:hypothetical protein BKA70DRAFT_1554857 [Coprinopsis sp. MPI-PUGE-AT-0042]|nr:hypothetical protein BKA70DRAFT_1554857 [Coprinopsis sp. MPI-PUGE-AT-0042]